MSDARPPDDVDDARNDRDSLADVVEFHNFHKELSRTKKRDFTWHVKPTSSAASPDDELRMVVFRCKESDGTTAKDKLVKYAERHRHELCLVYNLNAYAKKKDGQKVAGMKLWTSVRDHATFAHMALLCDFKDKKIDRWYEVLRENHPARFVVAIDISRGLKAKKKVGILRDFIHCAKLVMKHYSVNHPAILDDDGDTKFQKLWRITDASNDEKTNFHLVLTGLGHVTTHHEHAEALTNEIAAELMKRYQHLDEYYGYAENLLGFLDASIYTRWHSMRLPLMVGGKLDPKKKRPFIPVDVNFEKNTITEIPHTYEDGFADAFPDYMASFVTPDEMKVKLDPSPLSYRNPSAAPQGAHRRRYNRC
ncbi:hypothetical protein CYMTET_12577 [Cymbomonas tetramitiformis]|uniref:Uncharacterized protein n=1 Tax=Cymbomonas tetramitiformis TaxID=36881 RepID=A0AAE0GJV7_9CHLO|nr:hypothetical protein CYMTET_12577 [Cymbomonas tetramitiformis]